MMKKKRTRQSHKLLVEMLTGQKSIVKLAEGLKMRVDELAGYVNEEAQLETFVALSNLFEQYMQVMLHRQRIGALMRLGNHVNQKKDMDLSRKACVDMMKIETREVRMKLGDGELGSGVGSGVGVGVGLSLSDEQLQVMMRSIGVDEQVVNEGEVHDGE